MTVTADNSAIGSWTVTWNLSGGQTVTQVWNGALATEGSAATGPGTATPAPDTSDH